MADTVLKKYDFGSKCVCVGRVSTSTQSQTSQVKDLEAYAHNLGFDTVEFFFTTESGFLEYDDKRGWNLVTDFLEKHEDYRVLITVELSRLSRKESILYKIRDYLIEHHIQLIVKDLNYFLYNEWGEIPKGNDIIFALFSSLADSEMRQKKERFARSLKDYREQGYCLGGKQLFGYDRYYELKNGKNRSRYKINEKQAEEIRTIYKWYAFGIDGDFQKTTILRITQRCIEEGFSTYLHSKRNVNKCLKEDAYFGRKTTHNKVKNPEFWNYNKIDAPRYIDGKSYVCSYPAIFTGEDTALREMVNNRLRLNNSQLSRSRDLVVDKSSKHTTLLSKLLICPECGCYLHGDYRRIPSHNPNLEPLKCASYRCANSRGVVNTCSFKHLKSMPLLDSTIWAYCKNRIETLMKVENRSDLKNQVLEIQNKIKNIDKAIHDFDYDARVEREDFLYRVKTSKIKDKINLDKAKALYEEHIDDIDKELEGYKKRKQELEQDLYRIQQSIEDINSLSQRAVISEDKQSLYKYIHRAIDSIEILSVNKRCTVLKVNNKRISMLHRMSDYIFVYSLTMKMIKAFMITAHGVKFKMDMIPMNVVSADDERYLRHITNTPSFGLSWDAENKVFMLYKTPLSIEDIDNYGDGLFHKISPQVLSTMRNKGLVITELKVKRLDCYDEDFEDTASPLKQQ